MIESINGSSLPVATVPLATATAISSAQAERVALAAFMKTRLRIRHVLLLTGYAIMSVSCFVMVLYLRSVRATGGKGGASSVRKVILPAFKPLLTALALATGGFTVFLCIALATDLFEYSVSKLTTEAFYCGRQFVFLSVVVFMLQASVSLPALWRSTAITLVLSTYTLPIVWLMTDYGNPENFYAVVTSSRAIMLLLYAYVFLRPPCRASKRSIREFCVYVFIYYALLFTYGELFHRNKLEAGFTVTYITAMWATLCPLVVFRVLKADTAHWRGDGERSLLLQPLLRQNHNNISERAASVEFHVLIEMHRSNIIDIAELRLEKCLGTGSGSKKSIICGVLRAEASVAVKVFTPSSFDESCIADISYEAAICGAVHHPNIVKFHGICVSPPTIGLVLELCEASLEEVVCSITRRTQHPNRQALLINVAYMLDAARAVAYLHSFSPAFLHRKIRPSSFMVDAEHSVKLTEFGDACSLSHSTTLELTNNNAVEYLAPELINYSDNPALYGEVADVYALGMTMWDILHPGREKYPSLHGNRAKICDSVIQGQRPEFNASMNPSLRLIIESTWHVDPNQRPSAHALVSILTSVQEELAAEFAFQLQEELDDVQVIKESQGEMTFDIVTFTGASAIECMEEQNYIASRGEGIRLGNALLEACVVQPLHGSRRLEDNNRVYCFDEDNINLCRPLVDVLSRALPQSDSGTEDQANGRDTPTTSSLS